MNPLYDKFRRDIAEAQKKANKSKCGVHVGVQGQVQVTFIEPFIPKLTKKEVDKRFQMIMLDDPELLPDSVSILARPNKLSLNRGKLLIYYY